MGNCNENTKSIGTLQSVAGSGVATGAYYLVKNKLKIPDKINDATHSIFTKEILHCNNYAKTFEPEIRKMYFESGLLNKGIKILDYNEGYTDEIIRDNFPHRESKSAIPRFQSIEEFETWAKKNPQKLNKRFKDIEKPIKSLKQQNFYSQIKQFISQFKYQFNMSILKCNLKEMERIMLGKDAKQVGKNVHINITKMPYALPHELGHTLNYSSKGLGKFTNFIYTRPKSLIPLLIATAILRNKKTDGEESKSALGKSLDFVKDNCVALTAATCVPQLLEEGCASLKGQKMAKKYLSKENYKLLKGFHGKAFLTYLGAAIGATLTVFVADNAKNLFNKAFEQSVG